MLKIIPTNGLGTVSVVWTLQVEGVIENLSHGVYGAHYSSKASVAAVVEGSHLLIASLNVPAKQEE